jgi:cyclohexanone monooxygenase
MTITPERIAELQHRYDEERAKRLRPDGNAQYLALDGAFASYLDDPYTPVVERAPKTDHVTVACVGGGFAGLLAGARLREAGVDSIRLIDKAGDFGGTWYWNRYPGAQCDTASFVYMPLLEETGHMPTEKYAHAPEILEHCRRIGHAFHLYDDALFHTEVTALEWDPDERRWTVRTSRGDAFTATFVVFGTGPLHVPKLPGIEGIASFRGHSFHTSRWDYAYTGGDADGAPMDRLGDRRVAIIGTGATAVQVVPHLARAAKELFVFQRTPSSVDTRGNRPTDPAWFASIATPGWQRRWMLNFAENQTAGLPDEDLVQDGWTDIARRIREKILALAPGELTAESMLAAFEASDFEKMEEIRARADAIVEDPSTAEHLKAWYRQLCKRPCFHDEYLQAFNLPGTHLVDTDGRGVERIVPDGVVANGRTYEVDCLVFASGFEVGTPFTRRAGFDVTGRDGRTLSAYWKGGTRSLHGVHVAGFPNAFVVQVAQGGNLISNVPHNLEVSATTIAAVVRHALATGAHEVEVTDAAESAWMELLRSGVRMLGTADCTPGYYNNEGHPEDGDADGWRGYPQGAVAYFAYIERWLASGSFEGLEFR